MSQKENFILNHTFFDKQIFVVNTAENTLKNSTGSNQKNLFIVYQVNESESNEINFLEKILSAVKYDLKEDVLLVGVTQKEQIGFQDIKAIKKIKDVILLGVTPDQLGLRFESSFYQPIQCNDCRFLIAHSLSEIESDKKWKGALWNALQEMFLNN